MKETYFIYSNYPQNYSKFIANKHLTIKSNGKNQSQERIRSIFVNTLKSNSMQKLILI